MAATNTIDLSFEVMLSSLVAVDMVFVFNLLLYLISILGASACIKGSTTNYLLVSFV